MAEVWRPVVGYESHYEVSDLGRIRSLKREPRILRTTPTPRGYPTVSLCRDGRKSTRYVHHLVAGAFIGPRPEGREVCHRNGDVGDPRASNLRYGTHHSNMRDSLTHGTHRSVGRTHCINNHPLAETGVVLTSTSADGGTKVRTRCRTCDRSRVKRAA